MRSPAWSPVGSDGRYRYEATALSVFWPEPQYHAVIARWPHLAKTDMTHFDTEAPDRTMAWKPMSYQELRHVNPCLSRGTPLLRLTGGRSRSAVFQACTLRHR